MEGPIKGGCHLMRLTMYRQQENVRGKDKNGSQHWWAVRMPWNRFGCALAEQKLQSQVCLNDPDDLKPREWKPLQCWQMMYIQQETNPDPASRMRGFPRASECEEERGEAALFSISLHPIP